MPSAALVQTVVTKQHEVPSIPLVEVSRERISVSVTDEQHRFTKSSEAGLVYTTDTTDWPHGLRQISI